MNIAETKRACNNILSYEGFRNVLFSQTKRVFSEELGIDDVIVEKAIKNNDTEIDVLTIKPSSTGCMPNINISELYELYENGENMDEIIDAVKEMYSRCTKLIMPEVEKLKALVEDIDLARNLIECRLINADSNAQRLEGKPFKRFGEFALAYQLKICVDGNGFYMTQITDDMLEDWGIDIDELHRQAMENMNLPMSFVLKRMDEFLKLPEKSKLFILTNKYKLNGATLIISDEVRQKVGRYVGGDYYILPSSIHELLIIPKRYTSDINYLTYMIRSANREERIVKPDDFLSDNLYEYNMATRKVTLSVDPKAVLS